MKPAHKKFAWAAGILVAMGIIGAVVGVVVVEVRKNRDNSPTTSGSSTTVTTTDSNGQTRTATSTSSAPSSTFSVVPQNPNLHKSFYGMAYTPPGAIMPECGANIDDVHRDVQILAQMTDRVRLYGSDCNVTSLVLQAIQDTGVDLKVFAAIYLEPEELSYTRQKTILENALQTYGTTNVLGVAVGNEYVFQAVNNGDTATNASARVVEKMNEVRTDLTALGYNLPVGTSDTGGTTSQDMVDNADFVFANIHPWFSGNTAASAATFANNAFESMLSMATSSTRTPAPEMYQGEYGWPSGSDTPGDSNGAGALPNIANLQTVIDDWVCPSKAAGVRYFWFSPFDEPWKASVGLGVEPYWGLFDKDFNLKAITIPECP
ncbi:glycoside hydrolase [Serendipita vermifera]|nr:glycoside hydrolase [Serendipita vermifera]